MVTEAGAQTDSATPGTTTAVTDDAAAQAAAAAATQTTEAKAAADAAAAAAAAQTPEAKAAADAAAKAAAKAEADAKAKSGAPEKYEDFKLPDGVALDQEVMGEFSTLAKELNLSQENAQKVAALGAKLTLKNSDAVKATLAEASAKWASDAKVDTEIGGESFDANLGKANAVFTTFGTPALKQLLVDSGLGNHPELIRWAFRVSKAVSQDTLVAGRQTEGPKDAASVLYDAPKSQPA